MTRGGPKRLALLSFHSSPIGRLGSQDTGGMSVYLRQLAGELGQAGYAVDIFTRRWEQSQGQSVSLSPSVRVVFVDAGPLERVDKGQLHHYLVEFVRAMVTFGRKQKVKYDLIYSHYWLSTWAGSMLAAVWDVPHFTMFHTVGASKQATGVGQTEPSLRLEKERELVHSCHRLIVATTQEQSQLVEYYDAPSQAIRIVPLGVDLHLFRPVDRRQARRCLGMSLDDKVILYVGRIDAIKGIERLVEAVLQLPERRHVKLMVIGGDETSHGPIERLQDMARKENADHMFDFRGLVDHDQLPLYYSAANVCAVVSYYESFGLVALEALACGTPVIASDVGILNQIIKEPVLGTVLPVTHDPRLLAYHLHDRLLQSPPHPELVRQGVCERGWDHTARHFQNVLAEYGL